MSKKAIIIGPGPADSAHVHMALDHGAFALTSPDPQTVAAVNAMVGQVRQISTEELTALGGTPGYKIPAPIIVPSRFKARRGTNMTPKKKKRK